MGASCVLPRGAHESRLRSEAPAFGGEARGAAPGHGRGSHHGHRGRRGGEARPRGPGGLAHTARPSVGQARPARAAAQGHPPARHARRRRLRRLGSIPDDVYAACLRAKVLDREHVAPLREELAAIKPMPAVFDTAWVRRLDGPNVKKGTLREKELARSRRTSAASWRGTAARALVMVWYRLHRDLSPRSGPPTARRGVRGGARPQRPDDRAVDDLRVRRDPVGRAVRERRAEPVAGRPGAAGARRARRASSPAARTSRPARRS